MKGYLALLSILIASPTLAEYRVYQYLIKNKIENPGEVNGSIIVSTMDPVSYVAYHGGPSTLSINILRTWICAGFTGKNKDTCKSPYSELPKEVTQ